MWDLREIYDDLLGITGSWWIVNAIIIPTVVHGENNYNVGPPFDS